MPKCKHKKKNFVAAVFDSSPGIVLPSMKFRSTALSSNTSLQKFFFPFLTIGKMCLFRRRN